MSESIQKPHSTTIQTLITITVMLVTVIEVLDMTIVNVALTPMMGTLGANSEEITWVLTSYIVSSAVFMPMTGYLIDNLGQKRLLIINIVGFLLASVLCGLASNLMQMLIFRTLQGIFGAALVPLSQFILRNTFEAKDFGKAMAIWGIGIMVAPILGPTLGGYITEHFNWRWIFYLNIPICLTALYLAYSIVPESPIQRSKTDWKGIFLLITSVGALQLFLDRGNTNDWFESNTITILFVTTIIGSILFFIHSLNVKNPVVHVRLFKDRTFAVSCFCISIFVSCIMSLIALQPLMLESLMGYPTVTAGIAMAPRGIATALTMAITPLLIKHFDYRYLLALGTLLAAIGSFLMGQFSLQTDFFTLCWVSVIQGIGMGLFFVPLSTFAFHSLKPTQVAEASGLFSFSRSLGGSIGISIFSTILTRQTHHHWQSLGTHLSSQSLGLSAWLSKHMLSLHAPQTLLLLKEHLQSQALMMSFTYCYMLAGFLFLVILGLVAMTPKLDP